MIHQLKGEWETRDAKLIPYQTRIKELVKQFDEIMFKHIPHEDNQLADALATLSSMLALSKDGDMPLIRSVPGGEVAVLSCCICEQARVRVCIHQTVLDGFACT